PAAPISYLGSLVSQVEAASPLSFEQQSALLVDLRRHLRDPGTASDARVLLEKLRKRRDLFATIAEEIAGLNVLSAKEDVRGAEQRPASTPSHCVVAVATAPDAQAPKPPVAEAQAPGPEPTTHSRIPDRRERRRAAGIGMIMGTIIGAAAMM